ncbi:hypothetical protein BH11ACT6_BH11ACT6_26510 [soil metagenome]
MYLRSHFGLPVTQRTAKAHNLGETATSYMN